MSRLWLVAGPCLALLLGGVVDIVSPRWPSGPEPVALASMFGTDRQPDSTLPAIPSPNDSEVQALPFCIARKRWSAGELGSTVLYHVVRSREGDRETMRVGYFAYWSTERPWEPGHVTESLVPALFTDAVYSHFLFVLPGLQRVLYGPGDIEGVRVTYERRGAAWIPAFATAEDGYHREVSLDPGDFRDDQGRVVFMSDVWSHQLGAHNAIQAARHGAALTCFAGETLLPLTETVAQAFRLGSRENPRRARAAWRLDRE